MPFKIFYTDVPVPTNQAEADMSRLIPLVHDTRDGALQAACKLLAGGAIVWRIEGADGIHMTRAEIEHECNLRRWSSST